jgi:hypothetical protein
LCLTSSEYEVCFYALLSIRHNAAANSIRRTVLPKKIVSCLNQFPLKNYGTNYNLKRVITTYFESLLNSLHNTFLVMKDIQAVRLKKCRKNKESNEGVNMQWLKLPSNTTWVYYPDYRVSLLNFFFWQHVSAVQAAIIRST